MNIKNIKIKTIASFIVIIGLLLGCANKNVVNKSHKNTLNAESSIEKNLLSWQNISDISNSNFYNVALQDLYKNNNVNYTNVLRAVPSPNGTEGTITIPLNKKYNNLFTRVCVAVGNPWPYETITVYCDDKEVKKIKKIGPKNAPRNLDINTKNVDILTIKVKPGRKGYYEKVVFFDTVFKTAN